MAILAITGLFVGVFSSFFGVGGGIITVPILYELYPTISAQTVIGTGLAIIFFNSIVNSYNFYRAGKTPQFKIILLKSLGLIIGAQLGSNLTFLISPFWVKRILALILLATALKAWRNDPKRESLTFFIPIFTKKNIILTLVAGLLGGIISGLTGLGGGLIIIPSLMAIYKIPYSHLSAYSNPCMALTAFSGIMTFLFSSASPSSIFNGPLDSFQFGHVNFGLALIISLASTISSRWGVKLTGQVNQKTSRYLFSALLFFASLRLIFS